MTTGVLATPPILAFTLNNGQLAAGGSILTQVGGVNTATYQDSGLTTPLPNPIPLNSRGEVSNAVGASCQLFLTPNTVYTFTLFDSGGNQIWQATYVNGIQTTQQFIGQLLYPQTAAEIAAGVTPVSYAYAVYNVKRYGAKGDGATDDTAAIQTALNLAGSTGLASVFFPNGNYKVTSTLIIKGENITLYGEGVWASTVTSAITGSAAPSLFSWTANAPGTQGQLLQVQGIRFSGNSLTGASGNGNCFSLLGDLGVTFASFPTFRDCSFLGFAGTGQNNGGGSINAASIYAYFTNEMKIENCLFETFNDGVVIDGNSFNLSAKTHIRDCTFETGAGIGVRALFAEQVLIDGLSTFNSVANGVSLGLIQETATIDNCRFKVITTGAAVIAVTTNPVDQLNITKCFFYNSFQASPVPVVDIGTNVQGFLIAGNEFFYDSTVVNGLGIVIQDPSGFIGCGGKILANRFFPSSNTTLTSCILVNNGTDNVNAISIDGNFIGQNIAPSSAYTITTGISLTGSAGGNNATVINNTIFTVAPGVCTTGINISAAWTGTALINNSISGNVTTAITDNGTRTWQASAGNITAKGQIAINGAATPIQQTGFGTPTGSGIIANFPGATATLGQTSQTVAEILLVLKAQGILGA